MSKMRSTFMLLILGTTLAACGSEPSEPNNPPTNKPPTTSQPSTNQTGDQLSACVTDSDFPPPNALQPTSADDPCPDAGSACGNTFPVVWCKADGTAAIVSCKNGAWVIIGKKCP